LWLVSDSEEFDPKERAREKQRSREDDARSLASGEKTREQLRQGERARVGSQRAHQSRSDEAARVTLSAVASRPRAGDVRERRP
jgi:hypothetical protein